MLRRLAPVCVFVLFAACAGIRTPPPVAPAVGEESPEAAVSRFVDAWNDGDRHAVLTTFHPDRRAVMRTGASLLAERPRLQATSARVLPQCHPRGAYWKTAVVAFDLRGDDRRSTAPREEIVWLRLQNGGWWMYSL